MTGLHNLARAMAAIGVSLASTLAWAQTSEPAPAEATPPPARFEALTDGTVRDNNTGLIWAGKDNDGDVDWTAAQAYCQTLGAGWDLPRIDELQGIHLPGSTGQNCMGKLTCSITPLIEVSGLTPWSQDANGPSEAWYLYLANGEKYAYDITNSQGRRALCVRR